MFAFIRSKKWIDQAYEVLNRGNMRPFCKVFAANESGATFTPDERYLPARYAEWSESYLGEPLLLDPLSRLSFEEKRDKQREIEKNNRKILSQLPDIDELEELTMLSEGVSYL